MNEVEKVWEALQGLDRGDVELTSRHVNPDQFLQHNPFVADGIEGLRNEVRESPPGKIHLMVRKTLQDGPYVITQTEGQIRDKNIFFDIFRFEAGLMVEHWAFATDAAPPNLSGHTQTDGPSAPKHLDKTEKNRAIVREYYTSIHIRGELDRISEFFDGDHCIRHEPGVRDGVTAFTEDLKRLSKSRSIKLIKLFFAQGDFVFVAAEGTVHGAPCAYVDLYRVSKGKISERWGFPMVIPSRDKARNKNGTL